MNRLGYLLLPILSLASLLAGCSTPSAGDGGLNPPLDGLTASFEIVPLAGAPLEGDWYYEFDASGSSDPDGEIAEYRWDLNGLEASVDWTASVKRGFGRNGSYDVSLVVEDDEGNTAQATKTLTVDDLPYDYWGVAPERVNTSADGVLSNAEVGYGFALSGDGRYVTFTTVASNLGPTDGNGEADVYLKDMQTDEVELISAATAGFEVWGDVAMSADARYVAYTEEDMPPFGTGPNWIRVHDRQSGTEQTVVNDEGYERNRSVALSADGRKLLFMASTLNNSERPAWVIDLDTLERVKLGLRLDGSTYADVYPRALSADGRYVVFDSFDDGLVAGDANESRDVFLTDLESGTTVRVSEAADGTEGDSASESWVDSVSSDGRYVVFESESTNFPGSEVGSSHIYVKDLQTGELELASANAFGAAGDSDSILGTMSDDARFVAFGSYAQNLVPYMDPYNGDCVFQCPQGFSYVKDRSTGQIVQVTMGLDDMVPNDWDQIETLISADGRYVSFYSWATNLAAGGRDDDERDYYRAPNPLWTE